MNRGRILWLCMLFVASGLLSAQSEKAPVGPDRILLVSGDMLTGTIIRETPKLVEIRLAKGMVVGVEKKRTIEIIRTSSGANSTNKADKYPRLIAPRDLHFLVYDGPGQVIGSLRMLVKEEPLKTGGFNWRLEETWRFCMGQKNLIVQRCEHVTPFLKPVRCFYRESSADEDRTVSGEVKKQRILVNMLTPRGRTKAALPFVRGMRFPLLLREVIRQRELTTTKKITGTVYDPMEDVFRQEEFTTGLRRGRVSGPWGDWGTVFVLQQHRDGKTHEEWLDSKGQTLYLEANGLDLCAVRCTAAVAKQAASGKYHGSAAPTLFQGRWPKLRLPDPGWKFIDGKRAQATSVDLDATIQAFPVTGVAANTPLEEIARILGRKLTFPTGELNEQVITRSRVGLIDVAYLDGRVGPKGGRRVRLLVFPGKTGPAALLLNSAGRNFPRAQNCLAKVAPRSLPDRPLAGPN